MTGSPPLSHMPGATEVGKSSRIGIAMAFIPFSRPNERLAGALARRSKTSEDFAHTVRPRSLIQPVDGYKSASWMSDR
jgi:hypothetical protein